MTTAKVQPEDYLQLLLASPVQFTCTVAARRGRTFPQRRPLPSAGHPHAKKTHQIQILTETSEGKEKEGD
jgi:hypothetical protein